MKSKKPKTTIPKGRDFKMWNGKDQKAVEEAERKIAIARISLNQKMPFFGRMTLLLQLKADIGTPTMGTDGEYLFYNPLFVTKTITQDELEAVILHEVMHCALLHPWRKEKRHQFKWNIACDYAVNQIVEEQGLRLPSGCLRNHTYDDLAAEKIYDKMPKMKVVKVSGDWFSDKSKWGKEKRDGSGQGKGGGKSTTTIDSKGGKGKKGSNGSGKQNKGSKNSSGGIWKQKNKDLMDKLKGKEVSNKKLKDFWEGIFESAIRGSNIGHLPGYLQRLWKELMPKKDWRKVLANYLSSSNDDFNFSVPDRRFLEADFYLPDIQQEEKLEDVVIAVDTSGSISTWQFNHFMSEVKGILDVFPKFKGLFIDCDAQINQVVEIIPNEDFNPKMKGGGGTDFNPVFDYIKKENLNPRVLIYLTDGYGDFPNKEPNFPVLWLIDSNVEPPFGEKMQYEYEEGETK